MVPEDRVGAGKRAEKTEERGKGNREVREKGMPKKIAETCIHVIHAFFPNLLILLWFMG